MTVPVVTFTVAGSGAAPGGDALAVGVDERRPYTVVYDGTCKVCGKLVRTLIKWDRRHVLEIVPSQRPGVQSRFSWIAPDAYLRSVQLIGPGSQTWEGAAAVERIIDVMPKGWLIGWVFHIPGVRILAEKFYRWFARNRYKLGCGDHCAMNLSS